MYHVCRVGKIKSAGRRINPQGDDNKLGGGGHTRHAKSRPAKRGKSMYAFWRGLLSILRHSSHLLPPPCFCSLGAVLVSAAGLHGLVLSGLTVPSLLELVRLAGLVMPCPAPLQQEWSPRGRLDVHQPGYTY